MGVLGGQNITYLGNLPNGWTEWHKNWHTCADSSGTKFGTDWDQICHTSVDSFVNGHGQINLPIETTQGIWSFLGGQQFKSLGKMAKWLDRLGPNCAHIYADGSGNGHRLKNIGPVIHQAQHFNPVSRFVC